MTLTNGDVQDNWPPKDFSGFLDMVKAGGLPEALQRILDDKPFFRSGDAMGGAYEAPEVISDDTIEAYVRPHLASAERTMTWCASSSLSLWLCFRVRASMQLTINGVGNRRHGVNPSRIGMLTVVPLVRLERTLRLGTRF